MLDEDIKPDLGFAMEPGVSQLDDDAAAPPVKKKVFPI
jgi:hypothetical protein